MTMQVLTLSANGSVFVHIILHGSSGWNVIGDRV